MADHDNGAPAASTQDGTQDTAATNADGTVNHEAQAKKNGELADNYKIRAEKAEKIAKEAQDKLAALGGSSTEQKPTNAATQEERLSDTDLLAILENKIEKVDLPDIKAYAKLKGMTIEEALKDNVVKTIIKDNQEKRATANATSTGGGAATGSTQVSSETLLNTANEKGIIPESDDDIQRLVKERKGIK